MPPPDAYDLKGSVDNLLNRSMSRRGSMGAARNRYQHVILSNNHGQKAVVEYPDSTIPCPTKYVTENSLTLKDRAPTFVMGKRTPFECKYFIVVLKFIGY